MTINTPYATLSFVNVFSPRPRAEGGDPVYNCVLIFDPDAQKSDDFKDLKAVVAETAKREFGANFDMKKLVSPFKDAGDKDYQGYLPGHLYISPWSKNKPTVVNVNLKPILTPEDVWSGQLARANVAPFAWTHTGRRGVSFGLNHLQIIESKGRTRLDGRPSAENVFDDGKVKSGNGAGDELF